MSCILRDVTQKTLHDVTYEIESSKKEHNHLKHLDTKLHAFSKLGTNVRLCFCRARPLAMRERKKRRNNIVHTCTYCIYIYIYICLSPVLGTGNKKGSFLKSNPTLLLSRPKLGETHAHILPTCLKFGSTVGKLCQRAWRTWAFLLRNSLLDLFQLRH